jgi:membrane fusion protein (multidrug efflux system)
MSKGKMIFTGFLVALVIGLGYVKYNNNKKAAAKIASKGPGKGGPQQALKVTGFVTEYTTLPNNLSANGSIIAGDEVQLQPEVSGRITYLNIKEGAFVSKGTLLCKLNDLELQAQLKKLQAQVQIARSNEKRLSELLKIGGVSQMEYDEAINTLNNANADIELLKAQIDKTSIRAPFSGKLGLRKVSLGAYIAPGTVITSIQNLGTLKLDVTVPEKYAPVIQLGDNMQCSIEGIPDTFSARVMAIEPQIDQNTRNLKVRAIIEHPSSKLIPGAFVKIQIRLKEIKNAITIPGLAVIPDAQNKKVIVADSGKAKFVIVETGIRTENRVQITSGLGIGDTVITSGLLQIKPNMPVKITNVTKDSDVH